MLSKAPISIYFLNPQKRSHEMSGLGGFPGLFLEPADAAAVDLGHLLVIRLERGLALGLEGLILLDQAPAFFARREQRGPAITLGGITLNQFQALELFQETKERAGEAAVLSNLSLVLHKIGDYPQALKIRKQALQISEPLGDRRQVAQIAAGIGNMKPRKSSTTSW